MADSSSFGYRRLGRNAGGFSRNVTYFGILFGLVVVFSVFYLYTSASSDASALRQELSGQSDYVTKLKNELLELNVKLEELKNSESTCKEAKVTQEHRLEECSTNLKQANEDLRATNLEKTRISTDLDLLKTKNSELSSALDSQKVNMSAMQTVGVGQEAIVIKLNETIDALRRDLILKDELIKRLETSQNKDSPILIPENKSNDNEEAKKQDEGAAAVPPNLQKPTVTTTKSAVAAIPAADPNVADSLVVPDKAQPGDRVKIEEANQKKDNDGALFQAAAAQQQDVDAVGIDPPIMQPADLKSGEV